MKGGDEEMIDPFTCIKEMRFLFVMLDHLIEFGGDKSCSFDTKYSGRSCGMLTLGQHIHTIQKLLAALPKNHAPNLNDTELSSINSCEQIMNRYWYVIDHQRLLIITMDDCKVITRALPVLERIIPQDSDSEL